MSNVHISTTIWNSVLPCYPPPPPPRFFFNLKCASRDVTCNPEDLVIGISRVNNKTERVERSVAERNVLVLVGKLRATIGGRGRGRGEG
jgi:hypothetical protein